MKLKHAVTANTTQRFIANSCNERRALSTFSNIEEYDYEPIWFQGPDSGIPLRAMIFGYRMQQIGVARRFRRSQRTMTVVQRASIEAADA